MPLPYVLVGAVLQKVKRVPWGQLASPSSHANWPWKWRWWCW